jgi:anti-sigma-K factor RskA
MDVRTFEEALDRWGSNLSDWPAAERQAAEALLVRSKDVQTLLEAERRIDSALSALREHAVSSRVEQRILARLPAVAGSDPAAGAYNGQWIWSWLTAKAWRPALLAGVPLIFGFAIGFGLPDLSEQELADQVSMLALSNIYQEIDDAQQ